MSFLVIQLSFLALTTVYCLVDQDWCNRQFQTIWLKSIAPGMKFEQEIDNITSKYNSGKAAVCRGKLQNETWYKLIYFRFKLINLNANHESHAVDTETCGRVKKCGDVKECQSEETEKGRKQMLELECKYSLLLVERKYEYVLKIINYLNNCTFAKC